MSDTLSITTRAIDRKYLLAPNNSQPTPEQRYQAVVEKTKLFDAERQQNAFFDSLLKNESAFALRDEFETLRREKYKGILNKVLPKLFDESYNARIDRLATVVENVEYLKTKQFQEQYALMMAGATIAATVFFVDPQHENALFDSNRLAFKIATSGLSTAALVHMYMNNRNSHQMRPLNAIAYMIANITMYRATADVIRKTDFDAAQHDQSIIQWEYYDKPQFAPIQVDATMHDNVCNPQFTESWRTKFDVTRKQVSKVIEEIVADEDTK